MTSENENNREYEEMTLLEEIGARTRYIHRKVREIAAQVEDNYHVLHELLDSSTDENGVSWHDGNAGREV